MVTKKVEQDEAAVEAAAAKVLERYRVAVLIVAYNAERHIRQVLARFPRPLADRLAEIYIIDDCSQDETSAAAEAAARELDLDNVRVMRTPANQRYGGNQKVGYSYAMEKGFDIVVMLHGDGQYPPEYLAAMIAPFADAEVDAVLGSRMIHRRDALKGGMPLYKWIGNQVLTRFENRLLGVNLAEFHTGYRAYRVATLARVPFAYCSNDFHFDTEILIQLISGRRKIAEIAIPTRYGDEVCHVNGMRYAWDCVKSVLRYRLFTLGIFYDPLLDFRLGEAENYQYKAAPNTLHQYVLNYSYESGEAVLDLGAASGFISRNLAERGYRVTAVDWQKPAAAGAAEALAVDVNGDFVTALERRRFDSVLALDVLEHLDSPETAVINIGRVLKPGGRLLASTANIAYIIPRVMLLLGLFNYGKRGILDLTHKRLFTIYSFKRLLRRYGFRVRSTRGFGPPIRDLISSRWPFSWIDSTLAFLARIYPRLFAYNFLVVAERLPTLEEVRNATVESTRQPLPDRAEPLRVAAGVPD
jgi:glycosyltransferase involved in cell wall biosynthesis